MIMRYELIAGGVLLLVCAVALKVVLDLRPLSRLALTLNLFLAMLAAFHLWPVFHGWLAGVGLAWEGFPLDAAAFWVGLAATALPGWALCRYTVRDSDVEFPTVFERASAIACTAGMLWLVPCLMVMTLAMAPGPTRTVLPVEGVAGHWVAVMRQTPLQLYLRVAQGAGGERSEDLLANRIPVGLRQQVFGGRPGR